MICKNCGSDRLNKDGRRNGLQRYRCLNCNKRFDGEVYTTKFIEHFGVRIKDKPTNKLTRDNYCMPTNKTEYDVRKNIELAEYYKKNNIKAFIPSYYVDLPNKIFVDKNTYTDAWVKKHYEECMYNYDLNMKYFSMLDRDGFNKEIDKFIKENQMNLITDLNNAAVRGVYLLVLDEYKQVYIGISDNIKKRIMGHWSRRKEFGRLIFGSKESSVLSIDSFGPLDTTGIYIKTIKWNQNIHNIEEKMVDGLDGRYTLNRIKGGLNSDLPSSIRVLSAISSIKKRDL